MIALSASGEAAWQSLCQHVEWTPGFWLAWIFTNHTPSGRELFDRVAAKLDGLGRSAAVRRPGAPADLTDLLVWLFSGADATDGCVAIEIVQDSDEWKGAYRDFLLRLNERRERLRRTLTCGLVVTVPASFKSITSAGAPDLWSIRSLSLDVTPPMAKRHATEDFDIITAFEEPDDVSPHELRLADQAVAAAQRSDSRESETLARLRRASALLAEGQALEARAEASRGVEMAPSSELIVKALETLGMIDTKLGDRVAAERHYLAAIELGQELVSEEALLALATLLERRGATREALFYAQAVLERHHDRGESPMDQARGNEFAARNILGDIFQSRGEVAAALLHYRENLANAHRIRALNGDTPEAMRDEYMTLLRVGDVLRKQGDISGALRTYQMGIELVRKVRSAIGDVSPILLRESEFRRRLGQIAYEQGDVSSALLHQRERLALVRRMRAEDGEELTTLRIEALCLEEIGFLLHRKENRPSAGFRLHRRENRPSALESVEASVELYRRRRAILGDTEETLQDLSRALGRQGTILHHGGENEGARRALEESLALRRRIRVTAGDTPETLRSEAFALAQLGRVLESAGDTVAALAEYREGLDLFRRIRAITGDTKDSISHEVRMLGDVARILERAGDPAARQYQAERTALWEHARRLDEDASPLPGDEPISLNLGEVLSAALTRREQSSEPGKAGMSPSIDETEVE